MLLLVVPISAFAGWRVHDSVASSEQYQRNLRIAQIERARVLRFQLDEETGVRGYVATRDTLYLEPYKKSREAMSASFDALHQELDAIGLGKTGYIDEQSRRNTVWVETIAEPLIAHPEQTPTTRELERRGKQLTDDFRNADQALLQRLDAAANDADDASRHALDDTVKYMVGSTILLTIGAAIFGFLQARMSRRAFQNLLLFQSQKRIADALQGAFMNRNLPVSPTIGLHASYVPATVDTQVGGDWYDAFEMPNGRILFSIGDVAGHGLEAAVVMSRARQAIIAAALGNKDPAEVLARANLSIMLQDSRMVTAICGYIDPVTLEIEYATAGHPAPILARAGVPSYFLPQGGIALGVIPDATYQTYVAHAFDGALIVLYTDGVIEHKRDILDGERRLLEATNAAISEPDPASAIERLVFADSTATDDVAILTISFKREAPGNDTVTTIGGLQSNRLEIAVRETSGESGRIDTQANGDESTLHDISQKLRVLLSSQ